MALFYLEFIPYSFYENYFEQHAIVTSLRIKKDFIPKINNLYKKVLQNNSMQSTNNNTPTQN